MTRRLLSVAGVCFSMVLTMTGCSLNNKMDVKAEAGRTESAQVEMVSIPYNPSKPRSVLIIEPFEASQSVVTFSNGPSGTVPVGDQMAAQLTTALSKVGNFILYDEKYAKKIRLKKGEKGPYVVRATLTEFNEVAEAEAESSRVSLGMLGAVAGIAGAVTGTRGLMWTGAGVAAANPSYHESEASRKGVVAFDVKIIEKNTGRIIGSFDASGTFKAQSATNGISLFGIGNAKAKFASSAIGQALRVAMNEAVKGAVETLQ